MSACLLSLAGYTDRRGVENLSSGHRTRKTGGIFVFTPCLDSVYGLEGMGISKYHPPFLSGFEPPSHPLPGIRFNSKISGGRHGR
jgi:hypothetical protein